MNLHTATYVNVPNDDAVVNNLFAYRYSSELYIVHIFSLHIDTAQKNIKFIYLVWNDLLWKQEKNQEIWTEHFVEHYVSFNLRPYIIICWIGKCLKELQLSVN